MLSVLRGRRFSLLAITALLFISCEKPIAIYYNESPSFSVKYPKEWNVPRKLFMGDVINVAAANRYTSLKINVSYKSEYDTLADAPKACITALQKMYPETSRHKVQLKRMITLEDGTKAMYVFISCKLNNEKIFLVSSNVTAFKGNKTVMVTCTTLARMPYDVLKDVTQSLKFEREKQVIHTAQPRIIRIAVMNLIAIDTSPSLALSISKMIRDEMKNSGKYAVVERTQMNELLKQLQQIECTDLSCAIKVGQLLSVQKILIGSVMQMGRSIAISGKIIDVEKGVEEDSATQVASGESDLPNAVRKFTRMLRIL
jgi:TolB-like protein